MAFTQPEAANTVVSFALHASRVSLTRQSSCLTLQDRLTVGHWREHARQAGFDRMVIHDRDAGDAIEVGDFLIVHRSGQAWSRWGFARAGDCIRAWCCLTGVDVGEFAGMNEALSAVLRVGEAAPNQSVAPSNLVQLPIRKRASS